MAFSKQPLRDVQCTYPGCRLSFRSLEEMQEHKIDDPEHFYCEKCDVDCEDWADLTQHKVDVMAPFLEGKMKGQGELPKHVVCEFCGEDFRSFGGRHKHRLTMHRAEQSITCPGCGGLFVRASHMLDHLERSHCPAISAYDFRVNIQRKYGRAEYLENLEAYHAKCEQISRAITTGSTLATITASDNDSVVANDSDSDSDDGGAPVTHDDAMSTAREDRDWPPLPGAVSSNLTEAVSNLSLGKQTAHQSSGQSLSKPGRPSDKSSRLTLDKSSYASIEGMGKQESNSDEAPLFPVGRQPTTEMALAFLGRSDVSQHTENLIDLDACNIMSNDFDPECFLDPASERYVCPYPACLSDTYKTQQDFRQHMIWGHTKTQFPCPACCKMFRKPSALIGHCETAPNCRIQQADQFQKLVDDVSGGFLKAKTVPQAAIYRPSTDLVKAGQPISGVMTAQFKAKLPRRESRW